jgi:hypothetical protein
MIAAAGVQGAPVTTRPVPLWPYLSVSFVLSVESETRRNAIKGEFDPKEGHLIRFDTARACGPVSPCKRMSHQESSRIKASVLLLPDVVMEYETLFTGSWRCVPKERVTLPFPRSTSTPTGVVSVQISVRINRRKKNRACHLACLSRRFSFAPPIR